MKARKMIATLALNDLNMKDEKALAFLLDTYDIYIKENLYIFPNVHETLQELKDRKYKLALITNGSGVVQREKLDRFDLEKYFDLILIEGEQPFGKPDERIYKKALEHFGLKPHVACMVGDNYLWEVVTPMKLGLKGVWNNYDHRDLPSKFDVLPDLIVNDVSELLNYL